MRNFLKAHATPELKAVNKADRSVLHTITTISEDRAGDVVQPGGAILTNFLRNPVVLIDHSYTVTNIVGRASDITVGESSITARTEFADTQLAKDVFSLVSNGFAPAVSIGFRPDTYEPIEDKKGKRKGFLFKTWELLEYSVVAIPMNPEALQCALSKGWVHEDNVDKIFASYQAPEQAAPEPKAPIYDPSTVAAVRSAERAMRRRRRGLELHEKLRELGYE